MKSGTGIIPEEFFEPDRIGDVMGFLQGFPVPGREKVDLLTSWARAVGAKVNSAQYAVVYHSGTDGPNAPTG